MRSWLRDTIYWLAMAMSTCGQHAGCGVSMLFIGGSMMISSIRLFFIRVRFWACPVCCMPSSSVTLPLPTQPGTGVADDKSIYAFVPDMIRYYLHAEPLLASVKTYICRRPADLEYTLDNIATLVVKRVDGAGGYDMLVGAHADDAERDAFRAKLQENPGHYIAQPTLALSRAPCVVDDRAEPRHVDLRPFVLHGQQTRIIPGAFCRVALRAGSLVVNSSQGGGGKDLWVLEN